LFAADSATDFVDTGAEASIRRIIPASTAASSSPAVL
jgi:hypothetical protein